MDLIRISPDIERARNILKMVALIQERIKTQDRIVMSALIIADYYEVIKELITAILLIDGYKTLSHKDLIEYIREKYKEFTANEISILDDLRIMRNRVSYEGFFVEPSYLNRNESLFKLTIKKLKQIVEDKL